MTFPMCETGDWVELWEITRSLNHYIAKWSND